MKKKTPTADPKPYRCELCRFWNAADTLDWGDATYARCAQIPAYTERFTGRAIPGASRLTSARDAGCMGWEPAAPSSGGSRAL